MAIRLSLLALGLLAMSRGGAALAESVPDPTRPPAGTDASAPAIVASGPVLQLIRTLDGKRIAVISGQTVKVGSKVNDAIVTQIEDDRVVLRGPEGLQTLKLFPEVEKRPAASGKSESTPQVKAPSQRVKRKDAK